MCKSKGTRSAFTLIELLVVVAIIALLISILLPSLIEAREQGKVAKCLSNLRSLAQSAVLYLNEWNDDFPFAVTTSGGTMGICSWSYGGKTNSDYWRVQEPVFNIPVTKRAMNKYILGKEPETDIMQTPSIPFKRTEVPSLKCPSDRTCFQRAANWGDPKGMGSGIPAYDDVGTSYHYNLHSFLGQGGPDVCRDDMSASQTANWLWADASNRWALLSRELLRDVMNNHASRFIMFLEDSMDVAMGNRIERIGAHNKVSKFTVNFIDGHAEYKRIMTRGYCGTGWTVLEPSWVMPRPGDPDQTRPSPWHYETFSPRNCDPVP